MTFPVTTKVMKKNVWQMPKSSPYLQEGLVLDNGHLLVPVLRKCGTPSKRTVHKEFGIISRKRCCWNSQKVDGQFSVQQHHYPGVSLEAMDTENCLYILLRIIQQLKNFFAIIIFAISSVFTEQLQTCVKNMNQLFSVKSRQRFLWRMTSHHTRIFYGNDMKNESKCFRRKTKWVNFVWMHVSRIYTYCWNWTVFHD